MDLFGWSFSTTETAGRAQLERRRVPLVVGCLLLGLAARGQAQTFTLPAAADTYLQQGNGNQNHGGDTTLPVGGNQHALLRFDPAALASAVGSGRLVSASLELFVHSTSGNWGTGGRPVEAHAVTADWTEAGATWNCAVDSKPTNSKPDCDAQWAGGSFAPDPTDTLLQTNAAGSFVSFDVTADVAAFLAGTPNQGWLLQRTDDEGGGKVEYSSREAVAAERPRLVLLVETAANDQVAPSLAITAPAQPILVNEPAPVVTLEYADGGSGVDTATLQVLVDGQDITASCAAGAQSASCRAPSLPAGGHTVEAHLRDHAGNAAQASFSFQLLLGPGPHLVTFQAVADSYLRKGAANRNSGTEPILRVREAGENRTLVQLDPQSLVTSLTGATLISAALELHIEQNFRNWGKTGGTVGAHRLTAAWTETRVTWSCAIDSNPANGKQDCATPWAGGSFAPAPTATVLHTRDLVGWVSYDVTADVAAFVAGTANRGWLLKKEDETKSGRVDYDSRQGTAGEGPRLVLVFTTAGGGDTTPPTVTITAPADGSLLASASPALAATYSDLGSGVDPASVHLLVDGIDQTAAAQVTASGLTFTPAAPLAEGAHTATVSAGDRAGNTAQAAVGFTTDSVPPALAITTPSDPVVYGTLPEIDLAFADATTGTAFKTLGVSLDGRDLTASCSVDPASATCSPGALAFGSHTLVATVRDVVGNSATATATFQLADQDPPTVAIATPNDGSLVNTPSLQVTGSASDDGAVAQITVNGAVTPLVDGGFQATVGLTEGANEIRVAATDTSGKQTLATVTVTLDTTAPVLTIDSPAPGQAVNGGTVRVSGRVTDENGVDAVEVNGTPVSLALDRFTLDLPIVNGHNTVQVRGVDRAGNARTASVDVVRFTLPAVTIGSPVDLGTLAATTVDVTGTVSEPVATVTVNGLPGAVSGSAFTVSGVPLVEGGNTLTATVTTADGRVGTSSINVVRDLTPPHIAVESPEPGAVLYDDAVTVSGLANDIVAGTVNAAQVSVTVNGRPATVANRSFVAAGVPLALGDNPLTVVAVDASGNSTQTRLTVRRVPAAATHVEALSGDGQQAAVGTPLPQPLVAAVLNAAGNPIPGKVVLFTLRGNNGSLDGGKRQIAVSTDASGRATAHFTLGTRAGAGNQAVEAAVTGIPGTARFTATGLPGPGALLLLDAGDQQVGVAGQALPRPLVAVVTDTGFNRLPGVAVDLRVVKGQGHFEQGLQEITLTSDDDGRVIVPFVLDPLEGIGNNVVEATIPGLAGSPVASFAASGRAAGDPAATTISGIVLDNSNVPVEGVTIRVRDTSLATQTDPQGQFHIPSAPVGTAKLIVDGSTANRPGSWPDLEFDLTTIAGRDNTLNMPIFLLPLDLAHGVQIDETHGATLTLPAIPGFSLEIAPGSVTFPGGSKSGAVSVTLVHSDKVPMVPNFGQQPRFIVTIQPAGARFDPPARLILPNVEGLAPGEVTEFYSFDHDLGHFVSIGPATVSDDGMTISSNRGVGIVKAGWHCGGNPNSSGTPHNCPPCQRCVNGHCEMDPNAGPNCFSVKIDQPTQGQMLDITAEPKMPDVHARARIVGLDPDPTAQTTFTWKTQISLKSVECDSRVHASREITHPDINATAVGSDYQPQFQAVRGGHLTMTASATINGNTAQDVTKDVILRGTNPARSDIQGALPHNALRQIACQESGQRQFAAAPDGGMNKCPLFSGDHLGGVGVMQITNPAPTFDQHWDWHTNVAAGISKFSSTTSAAQGYSQQLARSSGFMSLVTAYNARRSQSHLAPLTIQIPALTQGNFDNDFEQRERDAIRGYNGFGGPRFLGLVLHEYRLVLDGDGYLVLTVDEAHLQGTAQWEQVPVTARGSFGEPNYVALVLGRTPSCQ